VCDCFNVSVCVIISVSVGVGSVCEGQGDPETPIRRRGEVCVNVVLSVDEFQVEKKHFHILLG
jgi:hypothetical protein